MAAVDPRGIDPDPPLGVLAAPVVPDHARANSPSRRSDRRGAGRPRTASSGTASGPWSAETTPNTSTRATGGRRRPRRRRMSGPSRARRPLGRSSPSRARASGWPRRSRCSRRAGRRAEGETTPSRRVEPAKQHRTRSATGRPLRPRRAGDRSCTGSRRIRRPRAGSRAGRSSRSDRPRPPGPGSAPRFARPERSSARDVGICRCPVWTDVNCAPADRPLTSGDGRHQNPVQPDPPRGSPREAIPPAQFATRPADRHPRHHPPRPGRHSRARLRSHARVQRPRRDDRRPAGRERRPRHAGPGRHRRPRARGPDRRPRRRRHDLCRPERQHRQWRRRQRLDQRRRRQQHDRRRHRRQHGLSRAPATT